MPWKPPADAEVWTPPEDAVPVDSLTPDEVIDFHDPAKVKLFTEHARQTFVKMPPLGISEEAAASRVRPEDRVLYKAIVARELAKEQPLKKLGYGGRLGTSLVQGAVDFAEPLAKRIPGYPIPQLDAEQERFKQELMGLREAVDPNIRPDTNIVGRTVQQAARMTPPMVQSIATGKLAGGIAGLAGGGAGAVQGATALGTSGSFLPQVADQTYSSLIAEGADPDTARKITAVSAPIEAAIESVLPDPFSGYGGAFRGTARQVAGKLMKQYVVNYGKELGEEALQGMVNETALEVARRMDKEIPDKGLGNILLRGLSEGKESALPLALMTAPGAAVGGVSVAQESAARRERLSHLKQIRAKGYVSAEDGQAAGINGATRKERLANADAEIQQLTQEVQDAEAIPGPEAEVRPEQGREDVRGEGQVEVPAEPAVEGAPEVLKSRELLDWLAEAEAAAPEVQAQQPSRPMTPTEVQGIIEQGVPAPKPRQPEQLPPMEIGEASPIHPKGEVPTEALPPRRRQPSDYMPGQAKGWLIDAITRRPKDVDTPEQISEWINKGFSEGNWRSYAEKQGHPSLAATVKEVMGELSARQAEAAEQPRDVSAEIREALASGPVTVKTPQVPGGFKVAKVREDGKVVSTKGRIITPDETWTVQKPAPPAAPQAGADEGTVEFTGPQYGDRQTGAILHPSAKGKGWQVTRFDTDGFSGDTQYGSREEALRDIERDQMSPGTGLLESLSGTERFAKGNEKTQLIAMINQGGDHQTIVDAYEKGGLEAARKAFAGAKQVTEEKKLVFRKQREAEEAKAPLPQAPKKRTGRKPAPPPELAQAGITIKSTPKGWSVTGIPKEIADGLSIDYQGKRAGKGHFFRKDPTQAIVDAAGKIAEEAEQADAATASGLVRTRIGTLTPERAEVYEQVRADRLKVARDRLSERNDAVEQLLGQFVKKADRGKFKLKLLRAAERGDEDAVKHFDQLVQYAKDNPELGLPGTETELFELLTGESFVQDDAALLDEIDAELAAEIEAELGDASFDFGENVPEDKQTVIAGTEEAVADMERRAEIKESKKQFKTPKAKQTGFISGIDTDSPGQETMFNVDQAGGTNTAADFSPGDTVKLQLPHATEGKMTVAGRVTKILPDGRIEVKTQQHGYHTLPPSELTKHEPAKTKLAEAADKAVQEAKDELDSFGKMLRGKGLPSNPMLDPEVIAGAARVVAKFAKAGTLKFAALIEHLTKSIGQAAVDRIRPLLEAEWDRLRKSGEVSGMEPRTPEAQAEPQTPSGDDLTSIKKAIVNELREMVGLPEMEGSTPQTVEGWAEAARGALASDPKAGIRLVNELATNPRPISQHDAMLLQFRYRQLANELKPVVDDYFEAVKSKDPVSIATARTAVINARKAMTDFEETIHPSKETWGRTGVALQQMLRKDFSLEAILRRGQEANNGEELTPDQTAELTKLSKQLEDLQKRFDEQRRKTEELEAEIASKRQHEETVTKAKQEKVHKKSDKRKDAEKKVADAWAEWKKAAGTTAPAGIPVQLLEPAVKLAKAYVELGYVRFGEFMAAVRQNVKDADEKLFRQAWKQATGDAGVEVSAPEDRGELSKAAREIQRTLVELGMTDREKVIDAVHEILKEELPDLTRRQTMDALSRYGQFQIQTQGEIEKLIRGMNSEILKLSQIDQIEKAMRRVDELRAAGKTDAEIGKALADEKLLVEATGLVRDKPSQTVRQLTQKYNELKKALPATPEGKAGLLQTALAQVERALSNRIQDLRWEIEKGQKIVREKHERPTSERVKALEAERDGLLKIHKEMFPPKKKTLTEAQRIQSAIRAADRAIEQLEKQLETRDFDQEKRGTLASPELDSRRARLAQLRAARESAKALEMSQWEGEGGAVPRGKVPLTKEQIARRVYEASLRKRIADYQQILAEGDFSPKLKKGPRELSSSELKLKREMEDVRHEVLQKYVDYQLSHLHGIAWGFDKISEAAHLSRALITSFDLSALGRQGGLVAAGHPVLAKRALVGTIASIAHSFSSENALALLKGVSLENAKKFMKTIDSRQAEFDFMHKLTNGPNGEFRNQAGLDLPSSDEKITKQEEAFQGRWGKLLPGIAISGRLYTMILNKLRADLFDLMVENLGRGGKVTIDEAKIIAEFVNVATGRSQLQGLKGVPILGWLASMESSSHHLNTVFFAPRFVASRFQYLAMPFYLPFQGGLKSNWRVKLAILQEYGRTATGIATVLGTFALLGMLLRGDDDEPWITIELDSRSADYLNVRIGETRLDFTGGLSSVFVLASKMWHGQSKSSVSGKIRDFGDPKEYKPETRLSTLWRFMRTKFAPVPGAIATIADDWTNVAGEKETPLSLATSMVTSLSLRDVAVTMQAQGIPIGSALSVLSILGVGMNTYGPKTEYMTGSPEEREAQIKNDLKTLSWDSPEPAYSEFLTEGQLEAFEQRRQEKRGLVVYNATYTGENEDELVTRDKNREYLTEMGVSFEEAKQLLKDYYRRPDEKGRRGEITEGYYPKIRALKRLMLPPSV